MKKAALLFIALVSGGLTAFYFSVYATGGNILGNGPIVIPDSPQPRLTRSYIPPSQVPSSRITVPVKLSMDDLQSLANRNLVRQYNGDNEYLDGTIKGKLNYRIKREEDAKIGEENGKIKISLPVKFHVRFAGSFLAAVVRVPFSAQAEGALNVYITLKPGIRRDWSIKTDAQIDFEWTKSPKLSVAGIKVGLQGESDKFLREAIRENLYKIDEAINKEVRLRDIMQREWDKLTEPIRAGDSVVLHIDPRGVAASPLDVTPEGVTLRASVEAGISLSMGMGDVAGSRKKNLPPLEEYVPGNESVLLNVKALLNYDALEQEAMKALSGVKIDMGIASVSVRSLRLMGSGDRLIAAFGINAGDSGGTIYAAGEPYFDEETRTLSISNFALDEGTRGGLVETAAWLLRPVLLNVLSEKLSWELGPEIDKLTEEAREIIASRELGDEFELKGTLESAKFGELRVTAQGIEIGLNIDGTATLNYIPK
ncbi:MAG: DUF4403 family protein [Synergistaceae bacterium]|nr:DUF4403 family protein [Synergistaceae bacterium]